MRRDTRYEIQKSDSLGGTEMEAGMRKCVARDCGIGDRRKMKKIKKKDGSLQMVESADEEKKEQGKKLKG